MYELLSRDIADTAIKYRTRSGASAFTTATVPEPEHA